MSVFQSEASRSATGLAAGAALLLVLGMAAGCSKEKLDELVEQAKQQADQVSQSVKESAQSAGERVSQAAQAAQEQTGLAGSAEITLDAPMKTQACYVRLISFQDGRPGALQFLSAWEADKEAFPSVFLHAQTQAASLSELAGQVIEAQVYAMPQAGGPLWRTPDGERAQLRILSVDGQMMRAELVGGNLVEVGSGQAAAAAGRLEAVAL